ncbi:MAG: bifunctional DNA-formamidopyrimidine glycosylase/DNA-(apurinic or apyrimidinic site) lyase [Pirellulaceae bacterium]
MPELPEVETMRRGIAGAAGGRIVAARLNRCRKKPLTMTPSWRVISRRLKDQRIRAVDRHGKRLIIRLENDWSMVIEPRMTGLVLVDEPPTTEHKRFELELTGSDCDRVVYWDRRGLGQVFLLDAAGLNDYLSPSRIGPDAMLITVEQLRDNLRQRRIAIKVGLLDQKAVAGVGNIYASELLHLAGVDPRKACNRITRSQWESIHERMLHVLATAIAYEGSTLSDGTYRTALNDPGEYQHEHRVYDCEDERCATCGRGMIRRIVQAQRSTYFCNKCQKR